MSRIRVPKIYSPYGPRPRRSAQLILIWMAILVVALVATFYLTTRERGAITTTGVSPLKVPDAKANDGKEKVEGAARGLARMMSKMMP
ncbi:hypothetical protein GGR53DRAFT_488436 [Hypoxylon sp. FL1150]|nr:hypothetical protein GGR53DRAFT_488436 [Hypoxylon sp. FL1150]